MLHFSFSQSFITGADLSYTNSIIDNGGVYRNGEGIEVDPYQFFSEKGAKMVRLRLWHTPENIQSFCGGPIHSSNLEDVMLAAMRARNNGIDIILSIHYGDYFNDPGNQLRPNAWMGLSHEVLLDSIYYYTYYILENLYDQNTVPAIVSIGNETTNGFVDETIPTDGFAWPEDADKFNAGLDAIDDFNVSYSQNILKAAHFTESTAQWVTREFIDHGVSNFDVIGISYYPFFSPETTLDDIGALFSTLKNDFNKSVMMFETGFIWTNDYADDYPNFISNNGNVLNFPTTPDGQKDFLLALCQVIKSHDGLGVIYWEPGWISSAMCDKWGRGSSYENASFFNFKEDNISLPAFDFLQFEDTLSYSNFNIQTQIKAVPNPFINNTTITYHLDEPNKVVIEIYDISGKQIASFTKVHAIGTQKFLWDAELLKSGIYYYRLESNNQVAYGKLLKVK
jgi:arabinogalactan endo-1,4-beta-galactosidase